MWFYYLDLLSESPKNFIFKKEANKTNFGAILTIIFFIIFIFISILYILDFRDTVKTGEYQIEYNKIINKTRNEDLPSINSDPQKNPNKTFYLSLTNNDDNSLSDNFQIYDHGTHEKLKKENNGIYLINKNLTEFELSIIYKCQNEYFCSIREEDKASLGYFFQFIYRTPNISHQALIPVDNECDLYRTMLFAFNFNNTFFVHYDWEETIYQE